MSNMKYIFWYKIRERNAKTNCYSVGIQHRHGLVGWFVSVRGQTELTCAKMHQQIIYYAKHRGFCYLPVRLSRLRLSQFFNFRNTCTCLYIVQCTYTFIDRWMQTGQSNKNNNDDDDGQWPWRQRNKKKAHQTI